MQITILKNKNVRLVKIGSRYRRFMYYEVHTRKYWFSRWKVETINGLDWFIDYSIAKKCFESLL